MSAQTGRVQILAAPPEEDDSDSNVDLQNRTALVYSIVVLVAELGGFVLVHAGQQMFWRQRTKWALMDERNVAGMREVWRRRARQIGLR